FSKKYDGYKVYAKSRFDQFFSRFNWFIMHRLEILLTIPNILAQENLGIMLTIPNILSQENLYKPSR
ncbi:unnamed protein product, partial [Musa hybrid cultivar]